jgi:hypothetical protein
MNSVFSIIFGLFAFLFLLPFSQGEMNEKVENCLTIEEFASIVSYIENNGKEIKLSDRLLAGSESLSKEISLGDRTIELEEYQDYKRIIIIDNNTNYKTPTYVVSNKENELHFSAYYSRFDTKDDQEQRKVDWCAVISELWDEK